MAGGRGFVVTVRWSPWPVIIIVILWCDAHAAAIGMPEQTARVGALISMMSPSIDAAPDGPSADDEAFQGGAIVYTDRFSGDARYWTEAYLQQAGQPAASGEIGQDVRQIGMRFALQTRVPLLFGWAPWLGAGLDVSQVHYSNRHDVDLGGFLLTRYSDRTEVQPALLLNLTTEWGVTRRWDVVAKVEQMWPLDDGVGGLSVAIGALFNY